MKSLFAPYLLALSIAGNGEEVKKPKDCDISMDIYPKVVVTFPGKDTQVRVRIKAERNANNRYLAFGWQQAYPGEAGGSGWSLDEDSPKYFERHIKHISTPGPMLVMDELYQNVNGKEKSCLAEQVVEVR